MLAAVRLCRSERGTRKGVSFLTNVISFKNSSFANFFYLPGLSPVTGFHPCKLKFSFKLQLPQKRNSVLQTAI